jgi:aspartyl-tRNA(Asn)/glutamyl-tRNA(Gln) amidotransferase subunit A
VTVNGMDRPGHELGVAELLDGYATGRLDPVEVVDDCLQRIDAVGQEASGVVTLVPDRARELALASATRWRAGRALPLDGVPFGVKDVIATQGVRTTLGSQRWSEWVPDRDAAAVERLGSAGAVMVAKLATPELAFGDARDGHRPVNPWSAEHWTGGSSSGPAVALAARVLPLALGTDTGGSIRVPSSYCGVTGLKPTRGLVPRDGVAPVSWTLDHTGPMARSAEDLALAMTALVGSSHEVVPRVCEGLRVGVPKRWFQDDTEPEVIAATAAAVEVLESLGATAVDVEVPDPDLGGIAAWVITVAEFAEAHPDWRDHLPEYTAASAERLLAGSALSASDYLRARRVRTDLRARTRALLDEVDVLVTPGTPTPAPRIAPPIDPMWSDGDRLWLERVARNLILFNLLGLPALAMPAGAADDGRPLAVQVVGGPHEDQRVLSVAAAFQSATTHHRRSPAEAAAAAGVT